jgi:5-methylcytosine-specific restriction endonuclease McrA
MKCSFDNPIAEILCLRTRGFPLKLAIRSRYNAEAPLLASLRSFYNLLPREGISLRWQVINKGRRRKLIRDHLDAVCDPNSIENEHIQTIDYWLSNKCGSRNDLLLRYGRKLEAKYGNICFYCGMQILGSRAVDHIFPFSKGGEEEIDNLLLIHPECNSSKNSYVPGELMRWVAEPLDASVEDVGPRLRFLVFLRDNFSCTEPECSNSLFSNTQITISLVTKSGLSCYDNLRTLCFPCFTNHQHPASLNL